MNKNLQPKDYAALSLATAQLRQEIIASTNFKKIMKYGKLSNYIVCISLDVDVRETAGLSPDKISFNFSMDPSCLPPEPNDDVPH